MMQGFFRNKRRTNGCVLLLLACVVMVGWLRSLVLNEEIVLEAYGGDVVYLVRSHNQEISYVCRVVSATGLVREELFLSIPYVVIVLPLSLLSGWFLLWGMRNVHINDAG